VVRALEEGNADEVMVVNKINAEAYKGVIFDEPAVGMTAHLDRIREAVQEETERMDHHCYAQRKIVQYQFEIEECIVCMETVLTVPGLRGWECMNCKRARVCQSCFPQAMLRRLRVEGPDLTYQCPACRGAFMSALRSPAPSMV
jgi:hypothetical protein